MPIRGLLAYCAAKSSPPWRIAPAGSVVDSDCLSYLAQVAWAQSTEPSARMACPRSSPSSYCVGKSVTRGPSGSSPKRAILARMEHPAIAHLIDVGIREGAGWIAMEFVRGPSITDYCATQRLDTTARIRLLLTIADAISVAHRNLVVHRDIKPVQCARRRGGHPKLIDFGIATALTTPTDVVVSDAVEFSRVFTPHYAAPEQVKGEPATVVTDVFGLGALAYRLLTGIEPFAQARSALSYLHAVLHQDVAPPSEVAYEAGMHISIVRRLRGDLDCILLKALARDPAKRYASIRDFADDLAAFLACRPVSAHVPSAGYRLAKFVRRRRPWSALSPYWRPAC